MFCTTDAGLRITFTARQCFQQAGQGDVEAARVTLQLSDVILPGLALAGQPCSSRPAAGDSTAPAAEG